MHVIVSSNSVPKPNLTEQLDWIYEVKFDGAELSCSPHPQGAEGLWRWDRKFERRPVHELRNALCGFKSHTVAGNAFEHYDEVFCGLHPLCREIAVDDAIYSMDLAKEVRAGIVAVRTGWLSYGRTAEDRRTTLCDGLSRLNRLASAKGVMVGVLNMDYFSKPERFKLLDELNLENLGITLDVARAAVGSVGIPVVPEDASEAGTKGRVEEIIAEFGSRILQVHLCDAKDGQIHLPIGKGDIDFGSVVDALKEAGYDRTLCLELQADRVSLEEIAESKDRLYELIA